MKSKLQSILELLQANMNVLVTFEQIAAVTWTKKRPLGWYDALQNQIVRLKKVNNQIVSIRGQGYMYVSNPVIKPEIKSVIVTDKQQALMDIIRGSI